MEDKFELITRNLQEISEFEILRKIVEKRNLKIYWGTATTGKPHFGYFLPIIKLRDFLLAGCEITILLADIHAFLDNLKAPLEKINQRSIYYEKIIRAMLLSLGTSEELLKNITFVRGSNFQTNKDYVMDLFKLTTIVTQRNAIKAGSQVVKQVENPLLSSMIYPLMQALDEEYLKVDAQFGGVDQRKIFMFARKFLPMIGYKKRIHLMNFMVPGLSNSKPEEIIKLDAKAEDDSDSDLLKNTAKSAYEESSTKMSSSDENSKIDLLDEPNIIKNKIKRCYCLEGDLNCPLLDICKLLLIPLLNIKNIPKIIERKEADSLHFSTHEELEKAFMNKDLHPNDLKNFISTCLNQIIEPIRDEMKKNQDLIDSAYGSSKKKHVGAKNK